MIIEQLASTIIARLVSVSATDTIQAAAVAFGDANIGLLVVCDGGGRATGVLSKSDLVRQLATAAPVGMPLAPR
jgi:CBS domain-containing protein